MKFKFEKLEDKHIPDGCYRTQDRAIVITVTHEPMNYLFKTCVAYEDFDKIIVSLNEAFDVVSEDFS